VSEVDSGNGTVDVDFSISSTSPLTRVRAHCASNSSFSQNYVYKDAASLSTGAKRIELSYSNWPNNTIYCSSV